MLNLLDSIQIYSARFQAINGWDPMYFVAALAAVAATSFILNRREARS